MPKWAWWAIGLVVVGGVVYYFWPRTENSPVSQRNTTYTGLMNAFSSWGRS